MSKNFLIATRLIWFLNTLIEAIRKKIRTHLHWQVLLPVLGLLLTVSVFGVALIWTLVEEDLRSQMIRRGELAAHALQNAVESSSTLGSVQRYVASLGAENDFDLILVVAGDPAVVIASTKLAMINTPIDQLPLGDLGDELRSLMVDREERYAFQSGQHLNLQYLAPVLISHVISEGRPMGAGGLVLRMRSDVLNDAVNRTLVTMSSVFVVLLIVTAFVITLVGRHYVFHPHQRLITTLKARLAGEKEFAEVIGENEFAEFSKALNAMLSENDKVDKMKSEFVSTVSHELRTPLTAIQGSIDLIIGTQSEKLSDDVLQLLKISKRNSDRLTRLINDILDLEKIQSGRLEFEFGELDLVEQARNALVNNEGYAQQYDVKLAMNSSVESAPIIGDEFRLQQVFANLLSNAVKFSNEKGEVVLSINGLELGYRVGVRNKGRKIPEDFRNKIFKPFAQVDSSDSRLKGGAGLGLSITKSIIEHHNGQMDYFSDDHETEVFFLLPRL